MITDLEKEVDRLTSFQQVFIADNQRLESKLKELSSKRRSLSQQCNPLMVDTLSLKYKEHLKDEEDLKKLIEEYQMAIDYLKNRHSSIISNQSYHTPNSSRGGCSEVDNVDKELQEEDENLSFYKNKYQKVKNLYNVLQGLKKKVAQEMSEKKKFINLGIEGLEDLNSRLELLRSLEIMAGKLNKELIYTEQICREIEKTKECWEHHLETLDEFNEENKEQGVEFGKKVEENLVKETKKEEAKVDHLHWEEYALILAIVFMIVMIFYLI